MTTDEQARAFAVLAANVRAVAHEQERLQDDIAAAMDAGLLSATGVVDHVLPSWMPWVVERVVAVLIGKPLRRIAERTGRELTTELLMTLRVPGAVLRLHRDVPPLADGSLFPAVLAELLDSPEEVASAVAVYREWDRTGGSGLHDGVEDWAVLTQRMSYIVNLFRGRRARSVAGCSSVQRRPARGDAGREDPRRAPVAAARRLTRARLAAKLLASPSELATAAPQRRSPSSPFQPTSHRDDVGHPAE